VSGEKKKTEDHLEAKGPGPTVRKERPTSPEDPEGSIAKRVSRPDRRAGKSIIHEKGQGRAGRVSRVPEEKRMVVGVRRYRPRGKPQWGAGKINEGMRKDISVGKQKLDTGLHRWKRNRADGRGPAAGP